MAVQQQLQQDQQEEDDTTARGRSSLELNFGRANARRRATRRSAHCARVTADRRAMSGSTSAEELTAPEAEEKLQRLRGLCDEVTRKINELDLDRNEHTLVLEALAPLDPGRKCYRLVNNVVVERTVAEVMPAVKTNRDQIVTMMNGLGTQLEAKQKEADEISSKYRISSTPAPAQQPKGGGQAAEPAEQQGVLI